MKKALLLLCFSCLSLFLPSQNRKYIDRAYEYATNSLTKGDLPKTKAYLMYILSEDSSYYNAYKLLGEIFLITRIRLFNILLESRN